ncbi:MAG: tetratricopeptide repeat protein [Pseudomonadota bacterium]
MTFRNPPWLSMAAAGVLILAVMGAFANSLSGPFVYDDLPGIVENPSLSPDGAFLNLWKDVPHGVATRPVIQLSLAVNHALGGLDPFGYHLFNLAVHVLASLLLFGVLLATFSGPRLSGTFGPRAPALAFFIALLWAVHPLQTESVTYVIQRCESLMGMFLLLALYLSIRGFRSSRPLGWHVPAVFAFFLAAGSKEVAAAGPLVILAYDHVFERRGLRRCLSRSPVLYAGLALGLAAMGTWYVLAGKPVTDVRAVVTYSRTDYLWTQARVVLHYLGQSLWPANLSFSQYWVPRGFLGSLPAVAAAAALFATSAWGALFRRSPAGFAGLAFFLILAPSSSFAPLICLAAEHRMYLPLAAPVALVVAGGYWGGTALSRLPALSRPGVRATGRWGGVLLLCVLALVLGLLTRERNRVYQSETALWRDTAEKTPGNPLALYNLGTCLLAEGDEARAEEAFRMAIAVGPGMAGPHYNLANLLAQSGRLAEARDEYQKVLVINPENPMARMNLGNTLLLQGEPQKAEGQYRRVTEISPGDPRAWRNLGLVQARLGKGREAAQSLSRALDLDPGDRAAQKILQSLGTAP